MKASDNSSAGHLSIEAMPSGSWLSREAVGRERDGLHSLAQWPSGVQEPLPWWEDVHVVLHRELQTDLPRAQAAQPLQGVEHICCLC